MAWNPSGPGAFWSSIANIVFLIWSRVGMLLRMVFSVCVIEGWMRFSKSLESQLDLLCKCFWTLLGTYVWFSLHPWSKFHQYSWLRQYCCDASQWWWKDGKTLSSCVIDIYYNYNFFGHFFLVVTHEGKF